MEAIFLQLNMFHSISVLLVNLPIYTYFRKECKFKDSLFKKLRGLIYLFFLHGVDQHNLSAWFMEFDLFFSD